MPHADKALSFGCDPEEHTRRNAAWKTYHEAHCADWTPRDEAHSKSAFNVAWNARGDQRCKQCRD